MSKILFFIPTLFLISCSYSTSMLLENCEPREEVSEGYKIAQRYKYIKREEFMGTPTGKETSSYDSCEVKACETGYRLYSDLSSVYFSKYVVENEIPETQQIDKSLFVNYRNICVDISEIDCGKQIVFDYTNLVETDGKLNIRDVVTIDSSIACSSSEIQCSEGFSVNNSDPDNSTCVATVSSCGEIEMDDGVSEANKTFNEDTDSYGECVATSCSEGYTLNNNSCDQDVVNGCTDNSAENYNPSATQDDNSCTYSSSNPCVSEGTMSLACDEYCTNTVGDDPGHEDYPICESRNF